MNEQEKILLHAAVLWSFADGMLGPLFSVFTERIGGDVLSITWAWAIYLMVTGVCAMYIGAYSDKHNKALLLTLGYALTSLFTFGYIFVDSPIELMVIQAGLGFALALSNPTWSALYAKYTPKKESGSRWGFADGEGKIATGVAILCGGYIVSVFSFEVLFIMMGTLFATAAVYQARMLRM